MQIISFGGKKQPPKPQSNLNQTQAKPNQPLNQQSKAPPVQAKTPLNTDVFSRTKR